MVPPQSQSHTSETPRDWFLAAIETDGTVAQCLDAVSLELETKVAFVKALRAKLGGSGKLDAVSALSARVRALENTLRFRLGILRPERPGAWYRAPAATSTGPFASTLIAEPVFAYYEPDEVDAIRKGLMSAWEARQPGPVPFRDESPCLWRTLLVLNAEHDALDQLGGHGRLTELPDGLPKMLESRALRAFLLNVRAEMRAMRERLNGCHAELLRESEKLWAYQREHAQRVHATQRGRAGGAAEDVRAEFKRRRSIVLKTPQDIEALRYMGFDELPTSTVLRQRYLEMAKRLHPDAAGGSDDAFKLLTRAYSHLSARVTRQ